MSLRPLTRSPTASGSLVFSRSRQSLSVAQPCSQPLPPHLRHGRRNATSYQWRRNYARLVRGSWKEVRDEIDTDRRKALYQLMHMQGAFAMKMEDAEDMFQDFVTNQKIMDSRELVLWLAETHKVPLRHLTQLALITQRVPAAVDKTGRAPPSRHKPIGKDILFGCCKAGDPQATLHILCAVLYGDSLAAGRDLARTLSEAEIGTCLQMAEELADKGHPGAMVVRGLFLEQEGKASEARTLYEAALEVPDDLDPHPEEGASAEAPLAIPTIPPWIALVNLLKDTSDAPSRDKVKKALERGAIKEDDPLAYYHLAFFEEKQSANWLAYMNKAAGAGYVEAMFELATFYQEAGNWKSSNNGIKPSLLADARLAKALNWLQEWRRKGPADLAVEWYELAATKGHKPAMAELVKIYEIGGNVEKAAELLEKLAETSASSQETKEWSMLTQKAKQRLGGASIGLKINRKR